MDATTLRQTLADHALWRRGEGGRRANLADADLTRANLTRANLAGADLIDANLADADLAGANLFRANLAGANLPRANLTRAYLTRANLTRANLADANLIDAYLAGADLTGACLTDAHLWGAIGNGREIKTIQTDRWTVTYTADVMQIGCQHHRIADWWTFDDATIGRMDDHALEWWRRWKPILQQIIATSPATPTGHEQAA